MNTRTILTASALFLGTAGVILIFGTGETISYSGLESTGVLRIPVQIMGAFYFAFALLNWMIRRSIIGGIYNKPIVTANFAHFSIAGLALLKGLFANPGLPKIIWITGIIYWIFSIAFGVMFFRHPSVEKKQAQEDSDKSDLLKRPARQEEK